MRNAFVCFAARFAILVAFSLGLLAETSQARTYVERQRDFVPGELLVKFQQGVGKAEIAEICRSHGITERENLAPNAPEERPGVRRVAFPVVQNRRLVEQTQRLIDRLEQNPRVRYAEPNYILRTQLTPNDPRFVDLYGLNNTGQTGGTADADIDAVEAWDLTTGDPSVIVFVIDTGVNYNHPDLVANIWENTPECSGVPGNDDDGNGYVDDCHGINTILTPISGDPMDDHDHGTHVSGTIGGVGNNGQGVVGVNWHVKIGACKFLNSAGSGSTDDAAECFYYVNKLIADGHNVRVTNNSWSGGGFSQTLKDAMEALDQPSIAPPLHACAAGNANNNNDASPAYPASYDSPNIIAVAATDHNDLYAGFSSYGATTVDLAAPGVNIWSTVRSGYASFSGTSMATPHVVGAAALVWSMFPTLTTQQMKAALLAAVDPLADTSKSTLTNGRLNVANALCQPPPVANAGPDKVVCPGQTVTLGTAAQPGTTYVWSPGGETTAQITVSPSETTTYTVTAATTCGERSDSVTVTVDDGSAGIADNFDSAPDGWSTSGLWHLAAGSDCAIPEPGYSSPPNAMYYGQDVICTYNDGTSNSGDLISRQIFGIDSGSELSFNYLREVESFAGNFDVTEVAVSSNGGPWTVVWTLNSQTPSSPVWTNSGPISLAPFAGAPPSAIRLRFRFSTIDGAVNDFIGWFIDDVNVTGSSTCGQPTPTPPPASTPTPTPTRTPTRTRTATPTRTPTRTPTAPPTSTPTPPSATMHVGDLDGSTSTSLPFWQATVTVSVHDAGEGAVSGATVSGTWSNGFTGSASCTTGPSGQCSVTTGNIHKKKTTVTFTVNSVAHSALVYQAGSNHDPDGDSNGTSITVTKP